ncbi:mir domain protein [Stylonychia lemnae]|uniref:Mir domain protein n=1 Tax=Stylonychia lemnae TaxID=5949 RepID=A0A078ACP3_STYLE|nr:mir domain protein [Stylonychia lemnae]|eukprot:CDW79631.1 mir domain protein [Stylonychia lemnae]
MFGGGDQFFGGFGGGGGGPEWIEKQEMTKVNSREQFFEFFNLKKHIFIEFYSPGCHYCGTFANDFNRIFRHMRDTYGEDQVLIASMNGWDYQDIVRQFQVPYYPYFAYIEPERPNNEQKFSSIFQAPHRSYDTVLQWMLENAKGLVEKEKQPEQTSDTNISEPEQTEPATTTEPPYNKMEQLYPFSLGEKDMQVDVSQQKKFNILFKDINQRVHDQNKDFAEALSQSYKMSTLANQNMQNLNFEKAKAVLEKFSQNKPNLIGPQSNFIYMMIGFIFGSVGTSTMLMILIRLIKRTKAAKKNIQVVNKSEADTGGEGNIFQEIIIPSKTRKQKDGSQIIDEEKSA